MKTPRKSQHAPAKPSAPADARASYEKFLPLFGKIPDAELTRINTDIPTAVSVVLGTLPFLNASRAEILAKSPEHPVAFIDDLEHIALAAWYAYLLALPDGGGLDEVERLLTTATPLRKSMLVAAEALADRDLLPLKTIEAIRKGQGHVDTANDLVALAAVFRMRWARVHDKTAVTEEEVSRAAVLGPELLAAIGVRENPATPDERRDASLQRARAFTLLARAHDENRRAVAYLRWHEDDADELVPSLFAHNASGRKEASGKDNGGTPPADPPKPSPA